MKLLSAAFTILEAATVRGATVRATLRPNREALQWQLVASSVGPNVAAYFSTHQTAAGTLLRSWSGTLAGTDIVLNRVVTAVGDPTAIQLNILTTIVTDRRNVTREAWASSGAAVRLFYVRSTDGAIVYRDSANDGSSFGAAVVIDNSSVWSITALAAVSPTLLFACRRSFLNGTDIYWLDIIAFEFRNGAWERVPHSKGTNKLRNANTISISEFWDAPFQFDVAWVDASKEIVSVVVLDDLAGRPSSTLYQRRFWSDFTPIESIDFAEPERDELIGLRMQSINGLVVLHGKRTLADSDFVNTQEGVLYYSPDGIAWSEAYITLDATSYNWGVPMFYRNSMYLVGTTSLWKANPTSLWGGTGSQTIVLDDVLLECGSEDSTDSFSASSASVTCINPSLALSNNPLFKEMSELTFEAGWEGAEQTTVFQGNIEKPQWGVSVDGARVNLNAIDIIGNIKQGVADRALVFPTPLRKMWRFDSFNELKQWSIFPNSSWGWGTSGGDGFAEALLAGDNFLLAGTGINGSIGISAIVKIINPSVGIVSGGANSQVQAEMVFSMNPEKTSYYGVRFGRAATRFELWKYTNGVGALLATGSTAADVQINSPFKISVIQFMQTLIVGIYLPGVDSAVEVVRYFDSNPLFEFGITGFRVNLLVAKPEIGTYNTLQVSDFTFNSHDPEWSAEDYLRALAVNRGIRNLTGKADVDKTWTSLGDWLYVAPAPDPWITKGPVNWEWNGTSSNKSWLWHPTLSKQDFLVDIDMQFGYSNLVSAGWFGQAGIACRYDAALGTGITLTVSGSNFNGQVRQAFIQLIHYQTVAGVRSIVYNISIPPLIPVHVGDRTNFRFVVSGPWYSIYINGLHAGTLYYNTLVQEGRLGFHTANGGGKLWRFRIPSFGLGAWPIIKPGETLDRAFADTLKTYNGWAIAQGDSIIIGNDKSATDVSTVTDATIYSAETSGASEEIFTHCRVISRDIDDFEISGSTYSPTLWKQAGRARWKIEEVDGLRNEQECRNRAWNMIVEQNRFGQERTYPIHMRLAWERRDLLNVQVVADDTSTKLTLMGISRNWSRETPTDVWQPTMNIVLQDLINTNVDRATERASVI